MSEVHASVGPVTPTEHIYATHGALCYYTYLCVCIYDYELYIIIIIIIVIVTCEVFQPPTPQVLLRQPHMLKMLRRPQNKLVFTHPAFDIDCFSYVRHVSGVIQTTFFSNLLLINSHLRPAGQGGGGCYPYVSPFSSRPQFTANINYFR